MLFKIILLAALGYIFFRLVAPPKTLSERQQTQIRHRKEVRDNDEYVDYEEVE
ncbi:MAG: hypothetical protein AAGK47_01740 [Bacteroidota bacterium]